MRFALRLNGTTKNKWDSIIDLVQLWKHYKRIIKENGAIVLTGQSLFSAKLIISNEEMYRYSLIWEKTRAGGFLNANRMPLQSHEDILVFYKKIPTYNPQMVIGKPYIKRQKNNGDGGCYGKFERKNSLIKNEGLRFPKSIIKIPNDNHNSIHRTQKPVALFEFLIKTYTNEGNVILDNCIGSGTTAISAINTKRNFIGFEKDKEIFGMAQNRVEHALKEKQEQLFL